MERSRHASHLASRSYRAGIPDLGGGDEVAGAGAGAGGGGAGVAVGAAFSGASAMARVSRHEGRGRRDSGEGRQRERGGDDSWAAMVVASEIGRAHV